MIKKILILAIMTLVLKAQSTYICIAINTGAIDRQVVISDKDRDDMDESESGKLLFLDDRLIVDGKSSEKYNFHSQKNKLSYYSSTTSSEVLTVMVRDKKLFVRSAKQDRAPMIITYQCIEQ